MESLSVTNMPDPSSSPLEKHPSSANGNADLDSAEEGSSLEESGFNWGEYLEETGASAAPHTSFKHVEISIQSNFQPGMKLEVANKNNPDTYWVATVITTCGQLLLLRYCGYGEDRRADFWCDVVIADLHPVGWCTQNNKALMPPDAIKEKYTDWTEFLIRDLTGSRTAPANLLEGPLRGKGPIDLITVDSLIELQDSQNPFQYWIVSVIENVGGRLRLRYVGLEDTESYDQWLFYLDYRLRPVGWCQENKYRMDPPSEIYPLKMTSEWKYALEKSLIDAAKFPLPMEVFKDHADLRSHFFTVGMKLETVNMSEPFHICPASVTKVFNNHFFQVTIDDLRPEPSKLSMLCHADSLGILPVQWCLKNGVNLTPPKGCSGQDFDWADYHKQHGTEEAPPFCFKNTSFSRGFTKNMKLEAVNPRNPRELCVASVVRVKGRLMWLHLEGLQTPAPEFIVDVESMDIFPVGWCEANAYPLTTPHKTVSQKKRKVAVVQPEKQLPSTVPVEKIPHDLCLFPSLDTTGTVNGKYCCPQLFINHRCFSGPYLNKGRIAELPQSVGPGKCVLVLKEVLSMIINAAYKPGRVLRELQLVEDPHWNFQEETLKAKYRGKTYRAVAKIVRTSDQVADFCRRVCAKLECCPNLFSPVLVSENCPENCSIHTKTKYTYYYGKRKKIIKPPIGESNIESGHSKPARRRKRRKSIFVQKKRRSSAVDFVAGSGEESEEEDADAVDDDTGSEETGSELRDDQTDTSSAEVPSARPRRAVTLRSSSEPERRLPVERARRGRRVQATPCAEGGDKGPAASQDKDAGQEVKQEEEERLILESNPLEWTVTDVVRFIKLTDCAPLAKIFQEQDIDGQALLLLTLPTVQECMELKLGPAIKLCHQIERVKVAFYAQYAN
ncbi:scm-like with four MBT domains protein 2 isoform X1 [Phyllostomus hastatus]|uniref:scm-like with four MBT domains protein 2 isoform X1 n=2 Tax=Phyllostomus hastatus TaxID=9423 RepID=UPI001E67E98B|nr:scm-like with four MBT domains protein 2 isoform X1 [Phyllostomus hastatus]XP_045713995.1 scm-like with four MBT domains protein 2 isoform X1 [Phyllostomus hastatus]XP_045713997.1 scm-like with four MBT domains protein 2 isoform X1 [Phyllostomus hastatus]XP_045713998.1 scm-like with four MBT domains protein 2 isoform X1 [Phyllostomus hastatus]XP_045713999.1 scm-like with four MBT domains protein 2 isoform X1 [Phyllostomus hastatus]XP_045714000.1 scm-like with four MBT domains protein 2 isof